PNGPRRRRGGSAPGLAEFRDPGPALLRGVRNYGGRGERRLDEGSRGTRPDGESLDPAGPERSPGPLCGPADPRPRFDGRRAPDSVRAAEGAGGEKLRGGADGVARR